MEAVACAGHGSLCVLKTGVRDGPNQGKSFYVCGAQGAAACGFVLPAPIPASYCLIHEGNVVELQVLIQQQDKDEYRLFYRCLKSKLNGKKWCGSIPWQDPKATKASKNLESRPTSVPPFNPGGQRNPFKVIDKNCEPSSWKQIKQGIGEESRAKGGKPEKESVLVSDKEKKSTSDSSIEREPLEGLKTKQKQSKGNKNDTEFKESMVSESKCSLSETWKAKNTPWDGEKHGGSGRESKSSSEYLEKEAGGKSNSFSLSLGNQSTSAKCPKEGQCREKNLKSCGYKETKEKECTGEKNKEMKPRSEENAVSPTVLQLALQHTLLKGGAGVEAAPCKLKIRPELGQPADQVSHGGSDEVVLVSSTSGKGEPEKLVLALQPREVLPGTSGKRNQGASLSGAAASLHTEGPQDPKALHNHLVVQLRQKKVIYCCCYSFFFFYAEGDFSHSCQAAEGSIPSQQ